MAEAGVEQPERPPRRFLMRNWFARALGVGPERKAELYISLLQSATLRDTAYWTEIVFACGIATLGLVLSSPAVVIGAMLISPLMGPILAGGLALATGDLILGIRSATTLVISCLAAILFATLLVAVIPFKEMTPEIAARTHPNTLDLVIALFSGGVGSVAISKKLKGVATSIPGVAIAVALLPPLCVVGYGIGFALSINGAEGMSIARGGGLLFLTNLIAILFTSMIVFLALNLDISIVRDSVRQWRDEDPESQRVQRLLARIPRSEKLRLAGSLPSRFLLIGGFIILLIVPLGDAFGDLREEIQRKQAENRVQRVATKMWHEYFARFDDGKVRSHIDAINARQEGNRYVVSLRVITSEPYDEKEKTELEHLIAVSLGIANRDIGVEMVEVLTSAAELRERLEDQQRGSISPPAEPPVKTTAELQATLAHRIGAALDGLVLPPSAAVLETSLSISTSTPRIHVAYLGARPISDDAAVLLANDIRRRLSLPQARVELDWIAESAEIPYGWNSTRLAEEDLQIIERMKAILERYPDLGIEVVAHRERGENATIEEERIAAVNREILAAVDERRLRSREGETGSRKVELYLRQPERSVE